MSVREAVLGVLEENKGKTFSGAELARVLGVSRNAVWKAVQGLKEDGYRIESATKKGYCLSGDSDILSPQSIAAWLPDGTLPLRFEVQDVVTSTNTVLKQRAEEGEPEGLVCVANRQTLGKGRRGRSFYSPPDTGIYMSILLRPKLLARDSLLITTAAAVAVARAAETVTGRYAEIKWVNDVYCDGRKICGILTEASMDFESGGLSYAVLGIGINIADPESGFPAELSQVAASLFGSASHPSEARSRMIAEVCKEFFAVYTQLPSKAFMEEYRRRSFVIGCDVDVISPKGTRAAHVLDMDADANLIVKFPDGTMEALSSGEVSVRRKRK